LDFKEKSELTLRLPSNVVWLAHSFLKKVAWVQAQVSIAGFLVDEAALGICFLGLVYSISFAAMAETLHHYYVGYFSLTEV
jgi:hypothetical protein